MVTLLSPPPAEKGILFGERHVPDQPTMKMSQRENLETGILEKNRGSAKMNCNTFWNIRVYEWPNVMRKILTMLVLAMGYALNNDNDNVTALEF